MYALFDGKLKIAKQFRQALTFHQNGEYDRAEQVYLSILKLDNKNYDVLTILGSINYEREDYEQAKGFLSKSLQINETQPIALNVRGLCHSALKELAAAKTDYEQAIKIDADYTDALLNLGNLYQDMEMFQEALKMFEKVLSKEPRDVDALFNKGNVLKELGCAEEAIESYQNVLQLNPNFVDARWNMSLIELSLGKYKSGWDNFEVRWQTKVFQEKEKHYPYTVWNGRESLVGKAILVHHEQAYGDTIQFGRYVNLVKEKGGNVILLVQKPLTDLFRQSLVDIEVIDELSDWEKSIDYRCPLMSLPHRFSNELTTMSSKVPYIHVDKQKSLFWANQLGRKTKFRVGLAWSGSETHKNDRARSIALERLNPLCGLDAVFYSLQKDIRPADEDVLKMNSKIQDYTSKFQNFSDTAAFIENLDLVITVDTSVAHLAAAMGKSVWILLSYVHCWRWIYGSRDSVWYPTVKLYQQAERWNWDRPLKEIKRDLVLHIKEKNE